jgi:uncharacterized membrane protein YeiH
VPVQVVLASVTGLDDTLERALELSGIFVFAVSGGLMAVRKGYDVVGVVVLALVTALGGGVIRDLLLGDTPPIAFRDVWYLVTPLVASGLVFVGHAVIERRLLRPVLVFDAAGLGLFCVTGTVKALAADVNVVGATSLGVVTAVGGGLLRDVLAREEPALFRADSELYAIPAALGAAAICVVWRADLYGAVTATAVAGGVFLVRVGALRRGWRAPRPVERTWGGRRRDRTPP